MNNLKDRKFTSFKETFNAAMKEAERVKNGDETNHTGKHTEGWSKSRADKGRARTGKADRGRGGASKYNTHSIEVNNYNEVVYKYNKAVASSDISSAALFVAFVGTAITHNSTQRADTGVVELLGALIWALACIMILYTFDCIIQYHEVESTNGIDITVTPEELSKWAIKATEGLFRVNTLYPVYNLSHKCIYITGLVIPAYIILNTLIHEVV
jgi:hypothetical protein